MSGENDYWTQLEVIKYEALGDFDDWAKSGEFAFSQAGLIVLSARSDFHRALVSLSLDPAMGHKRAMRITNKVNKAINALGTAKNYFAEIPAAIRKEYGPEIEAQRKSTQPKIDLSRG